jgi:exopolysaccharide biosynthesis WecB/TagA/CpsF family protein
MQDTLVQRLDDYDLTAFIEVANHFGYDKFGYVVTPNVDHLIRCNDDAAFRTTYEDASYILLDSRFLSYVLGVVKRVKPQVCTGSDLTAQLFAQVIRPDDGLVLIGATKEQATRLQARFKLQNLQHYNPPMGFIRSPEQVELCLRFVEASSPFRFCLLAVGSPQQEILAQKLKQRGKARGLALCIGASIDFLTGIEQRAPRWMQRAGIEWLYRLLQNPGRMARRYLVRGPRIFLLLRKFRFELKPMAT